MRELWLEVGFGGGEHALAQIAAHPHAALIACEVFENGICSLLSRLVPEGGEADAPLPPNLRLWHDDARRLISLLPPASLDRLFLLFPDPWPKSRHAKRRFVHPALLPDIAQAMNPAPSGASPATIPPTRAGSPVMGGQACFHLTRQPLTPHGWPPTRYEAKALREGRTHLYRSFWRI